MAPADGGLRSCHYLLLSVAVYNTEPGYYIICDAFIETFLHSCRILSTLVIFAIGPKNAVDLAFSHTPQPSSRSEKHTFNDSWLHPVCGHIATNLTHPIRPGICWKGACGPAESHHLPARFKVQSKYPSRRKPHNDHRENSAHLRISHAAAGKPLNSHLKKVDFRCVRCWLYNSRNSNFSLTTLFCRLII